MGSVAYHPLYVGCVNELYKRQDLTVWCGATFVHQLILNYRYLYDRRGTTLQVMKSYSDLNKILAEQRSFEFVCSGTMGESASGGSYVWSKFLTYNKLILNIRPKAVNYSQLNAPLYTFEFTDLGEVPDDRPIPPKEYIKIPIWIDAKTTAEMLDNFYDYELIAVTNRFNNASFNLVETDEMDTFCFKRIILYGEIRTKQTGDIL
jgi:hypothetical protein